MRLRKRQVYIWNKAYLHYRYLWKNLEIAVGEAKLHLPSDGRVVLDIGCGNKPYEDLFVDCAYFGLNNDTEDAAPDLVGDAGKLPITSGSIDLVFCTQVLEHVPKPSLLLKECNRILKPGGWLVASAPFYWPLHEEPHDFFRYTRHGLEHLAREAGFVECRIREDGGDYARFCLSTLHMLPRWLDLPLRMPLNLLGAILDRLFHTATLPANYTMLARAGSRDD